MTATNTASIKANSRFSLMVGDESIDVLKARHTSEALSNTSLASSLLRMRSSNSGVLKTWDATPVVMCTTEVLTLGAMGVEMVVLLLAGIMLLVVVMVRFGWYRRRFVAD
jgi:lysylphosphatidylglycerol synthetase-like protein (DUF2156 family)